jgi:Zn-dependent membrane protease YugP
MYIDPLYIILVLPMVILAMIAGARVKSTYNKYGKIPTRCGMTAERAVRMILDANGLHHITVTRVRGDLTDHYDPQNGTIALSETVYGSTSVAAIGVAAHEAGHAIQHAEAYGPMALRRAMVPVTRFGSGFAIPLFFIGLLFEFSPIVYAGIILFALTTVFELVTLPVELDASRRAINMLLDNHIISSDEAPAARKVLSAAAFTYLVSVLASVVYFLRFLFYVLSIFGRRRSK